MGWFGLVKTNKNAGLETPDHRVISKNDRRNRINQGTETNETRIDSDLRNRTEYHTWNLTRIAKSAFSNGNGTK